MSLRTRKESDKLKRLYLDMYKKGMTNLAITAELKIDRSTPYIWKCEDIDFCNEYEAITGIKYESYSTLFLEKYEEVIEELYKLIKAPVSRRDDNVKLAAITSWLNSADKRLVKAPTLLDIKVEF